MAFHSVGREHNSSNGRTPLGLRMGDPSPVGLRDGSRLRVPGQSCPTCGWFFAVEMLGPERDAMALDGLLRRPTHHEQGTDPLLLEALVR